MTTTTIKKAAVKKSPAASGNEEVERFLKETEHSLKNAIVFLREIILSVDKNITEHIKWNAPSFIHGDDDKITFNLSKKDGVLIIFHRGAKVKAMKGKETLFNDSTGLLEWLSPDRAVAKFTKLSDAISKMEDLKKIVNQWIISTKQ